MYAGFHYKILPLRSGAWRFVVKLQVTTLHTIKTWQIPLRHNSHQADRKLICEHVGVCSVRMCVKGSYEVKEYRSEKRKEARAYLLFWLYGYNGKITKSNMKIQFGLVC